MRSWVRKEAVAKCIGQGLAMALRTVEVSGAGSGWRLPDPSVSVADLELALPFVAAVACDRQAPPPVVHDWRWK